MFLTVKQQIHFIPLNTLEAKISFIHIRDLFLVAVCNYDETDM